MVIVLTLVILLIGVSNIAFDIQQVRASGAIYIRADGSVDPSTASISTVDNITYSLTGDINSPIIAEKDHIVLSGGGFSIQGSGSAGIDVTGRTNVTIKNVEIRGFIFGIYLYESHQIEVYRCKISSTAICGITIGSSVDNDILENYVVDNDVGIALQSSSDNYIFGNTIVNSWHGMEFGSHIEVWGNVIHHNNIINSPVQVSNIEYIFDDGYPSGGNYWSDYDGEDLYSGPYQNETGSDGIGDTPYTVSPVYEDRYPLMHPYYNLGPDVNDDGVVDIFDVIQVALKFGTEPHSPAWNPYCDLNQDGIVDIFDLIIIAKEF